MVMPILSFLAMTAITFTPLIKAQYKLPLIMANIALILIMYLSMPHIS